MAAYTVLLVCESANELSFSLKVCLVVAATIMRNCTKLTDNSTYETECLYSVTSPVS